MEGQQEIGGAKALLLLGTKDSHADESQEQFTDVTQHTASPELAPHGNHFLNPESATDEATQNIHGDHRVEQRLADDEHGISNHNENSLSLSHNHSHSHSHNHADDHGAPNLHEPVDNNSEHNQHIVPNHHSHTHTHGDVNPDESEEHGGHVLFDKESQQLNDAVEAAVMQYVGGTLATEEDPIEDTHGSNSDGISKRPRVQDDLMNDYHWDRFFDHEDVTAFERTTPRKRTRKSFIGGTDIDPELADLDASAEHELLVNAAIMSVAKELLMPEGQNKLHHSIFPDSQGRNVDSESNNDRVMSSSTGVANTRGSHIAAGNAQGMDHLNMKHRIPLNSKAKRPIKSVSDIPQQGVDMTNGYGAQLKYNTQSIENLVKEAANEANLWLSTQSNIGARGPRIFASEEIAIVDNFIQGYCRINNLTRAQICERVWAIDQPKDNFWAHLTRVLPYRSRASVYKHIRRQYHVFNVRAKWTKEEDDQLRQLTQQPSISWKRVGEAMNRMPEDCRDRWRNYIKCGENRTMNQWSKEEEELLKLIVLKMHAVEITKDKPAPINWTLVSEKMNGVRSRIQCRYKWNKLVRRDLLARVAMMGSSTKVWLLNCILDLEVPDQDAIDWEYIALSYHGDKEEKGKNQWTAGDFQVAFEKLHNSVRDHKNLPLHSVISKLLGLVYQMPGPDEDQSVATELRPKEVSAAEQEAASVANATVASVSSRINGQDAQQQEYSLWR